MTSGVVFKRVLSGVIGLALSGLVLSSAAVAEDMPGDEGVSSGFEGPVGAPDVTIDPVDPGYDGFEEYPEINLDDWVVVEIDVPPEEDMVFTTQGVVGAESASSRLEERDGGGHDAPIRRLRK